MISLLPMMGCDELSGSSSQTKAAVSSGAATPSTAPTGGPPRLKLTKITAQDSIMALPQGTQAAPERVFPNQPITIPSWSAGGKVSP